MNLTSGNVKSFTNVKMYVTSSTFFHPPNTITGERCVDMTRFVLEKINLCRLLSSGCLQIVPVFFWELKIRLSVPILFHPTTYFIDKKQVLCPPSKISQSPQDNHRFAQLALDFLHLMRSNQDAVRAPCLSITHN